MLAATGAQTTRLRQLAARWLRDRASALLSGFRTHLTIYVLCVGTYVASLLQSHLLGRPLSLGLAGLASSAVLVLVAGIISYRLFAKLVRLWRSGYAGSPTLAMIDYLFNGILTPGRISNGFHVLIATGIFAIGFTNIKSNIPQANPFSWDETFMLMDRAMHFGRLPHQWLMPLFGYPFITLLMNVVYNLWFFMMLGFVIWQGYRDRDSVLRQQFLLAYVLLWITGTILMGTIFSSAGPCFYSRVALGPDPYHGLMSYLRWTNSIYPIWAVTTQDMVWDSYVTSKGVISGISAMPSMHVGSSVLFFLCARASGLRWLAWFSGVFAVLILLGSVLLAWHYAVDGYAGALIALACWWLAGWWVKRGPLSFRPS